MKNRSVNRDDILNGGMNSHVSKKTDFNRLSKYTKI